MNNAKVAHKTFFSNAQKLKAARLIYKKRQAVPGNCLCHYCHSDGSHIGVYTIFSMVIVNNFLFSSSSVHVLYVFLYFTLI